MDLLLFINYAGKDNGGALVRKMEDIDKDR
jgi:hypothetical protein